MQTEDLTQKALERVKEEGFRCDLRAYEGGACGSGWDGTEELYLDRSELLYLIFQTDKVNGEKTCSVDVEDILNDMAYDGAWPDGEPDNEDISGWSYSGECEQLDNYLRSWDMILEKIDKGEINEDNLEQWLAYFDDSNNFDNDIDLWKKLNES